MLKGKTAVVTGGVRGIGKAIAKIFCENGANVVLCYRSNDAEAEKTAAELGAFGTQVRVVKGDVADPETAKKVAELIKTDFDKKVDILVNNAGITNDKLMMRMDAEDFTKVINANLNGAFYMMKELSALMVKKRSGVIINISSVLGETGGSCEADYAASKGALIALTKSLAKECGPSGVRVNCVCPGIIDTDMNANLTADEVEELVGEIPLETLGRPSDVAKAVLFLASDGAEYITGAVVDVNGGKGEL